MNMLGYLDCELPKFCQHFCWYIFTLTNWVILWLYILPLGWEIPNLFSVRYKDLSFQMPEGCTSSDGPLCGLLVPSPCGAEERKVVQWLYHPVMIFNHANPPCSPDGMMFRGIKEF